MRLFSRMLFTRNWLVRELEQEPQLEEAKKWALTFRAESDVDYDWVYDYAQWYHSLVDRIMARHDQVADSLVRYSTTGAGALAVFTGHEWAKAHDWPETLGMLVPVLFALAGAWKAVMASAPAVLYHPAPTRKALDYANAYPGESKRARGEFAANLGALVSVRTLAVRRKAEVLASGFRMFIVSVLLLAAYPVTVPLWRKIIAALEVSYSR